MSIDMEMFGSDVDRLKQHIHSSRELIGSDVADYIIGHFGRAYALEEYFDNTLGRIAFDILNDVHEELSHNDTVGATNRTRTEGWKELQVIHHDWLKLVKQAGGLAGFCFAHSDHIKRPMPHLLRR